ncbi:MAG: DUF3052 domain-containing protein [Phycisphaerales bacterium JB040]
MAGYTGTPLATKLGVKPKHRVALLGQAGDVIGPELADDPMLLATLVLRTDLRGTKPYDVIAVLAEKSSDMSRRARRCRDRLGVEGMLWLGWPKKSSGVATDLSDGVVRELGLGLGLVDNKTCAIDDTWSGLRFVRRLEDR